MTRLIYLLPLRYPTEKAYGVTIGNTLSSISKHLLCTQIWCESKISKDSYGIELISLKLPRIYPRIRLLNHNLYGIMNFYLRLLVFAGRTRSKFNSLQAGNIVWSRHPLTMLFIFKSKKTSRIVIEFHNTPNILDRFLTKRYISEKPVVIIGITEKSVQELNRLFPGAKIVKAEMGVPDSYLMDAKSALPSKFKIGYVGKSSSSGNDNNLNLLISGFSLMESSEIVLEFVGIEPEKKLELRELSKSLKIPASRISFVDHVPHQEIGKVIADLSIGLLPYEWNEYNSQRFPIKLVEYAAAGLWILVDNEFADGLHLEEKLVERYESGNAQDLAKKLQMLFNRISLNPIRNKYAIDFAEKRTYSRRAELIARELELDKII